MANFQVVSLAFIPRADRTSMATPFPSVALVFTMWGTGHPSQESGQALNVLMAPFEVLAHLGEAKQLFKSLAKRTLTLATVGESSDAS